MTSDVDNIAAVTGIEMDTEKEVLAGIEAAGLMHRAFRGAIFGEGPGGAGSLEPHSIVRELRTVVLFHRISNLSRRF